MNRYTGVLLCVLLSMAATLVSADNASQAEARAFARSTIDTKTAA